MLFQITSRSGVPDIFKRRNIASLWFVPICWCLISDNFWLSHAPSQQNYEALNYCLRWVKARVAFRPIRARVGRASAFIFPPAAPLAHFIFSFLFDLSEFCCFLMFAILEEPLPWGISQPKADFRQSGEVRRIFACQPNDVGSDRKVGGESLRRSEYFIWKHQSWKQMSCNCNTRVVRLLIHEVQFSSWLANFLKIFFGFCIEDYYSTMPLVPLVLQWALRN